MKRITFIVNPASGVLNKEKMGEFIRARLDLSVYKPEILFTKEPGHATEISKEQVRSGTDVVVAVGGDGSINEVAKGIVGSDVILGIIPAGSGNGLANYLKIPLPRKQAIEVINRGNITTIDTGLINNKLFVSIAGIGFDGLIAKRFEKSKMRGFVGYLKLVAEAYPGYKSKRYVLKFEDQILTTRALFIAFANSNQFGFNASIAPGAKIDDGLLDVVIVEKPQIIELPYLASLLYWRKIEQSKYIRSFKTKELVIQTKRKRWVNIDGEPEKLGTELNVCINPQSLKVLVP